MSMFGEKETIEYIDPKCREIFEESVAQGKAAFYLHCAAKEALKPECDIKTINRDLDLVLNASEANQRMYGPICEVIKQAALRNQPAGPLTLPEGWGIEDQSFSKS